MKGLGCIDRGSIIVNRAVKVAVKLLLLFTLACCLFLKMVAESPVPLDSTVLPGTDRLSMPGNLSLQMMERIDQFLLQQIQRVRTRRERFWNRDLTSEERYVLSVEPNRERLRQITGVVDSRDRVILEFYSTSSEKPFAESNRFEMFQVRWNVFDRIWADGLMLRPREEPLAGVIVLSDADQTPEDIAGIGSSQAPFQIATALAESGIEVLAPAIVDRGSQYSGNPRLNLQTALPHREWLYRQAYEMGRHVIGYEVQKVLAAIDLFKKKYGSAFPVGVAGYGEGGLIAFYSAALDTRLQSSLVSGYFSPREDLWREPVYRNVWGLLKEFGDAEIASLIVPRQLVLEHSVAPQVSVPVQGNRGPTPGQLETPDLDSVRREFERALELTGSFGRRAVHLIHDGEESPVRAGSKKALELFLSGLEIQAGDRSEPTVLGMTERTSRIDMRSKENVLQIQGHVQDLMRHSDPVRKAFVNRWLAGETPQEIETSLDPVRDYLEQEILGELDAPPADPRPRSRKIYDHEKWIGFEVVLDVWEETFAWGILLVPKDLERGEERPVVVCQHGGGGTPKDVIEGDHPAYHDFAARLVEEGFVVYAPHNPHNGRHHFGPIQRKANSIKASLWSVILTFHRRQLDWLKSLDFVDPERIGFYGLSYGGKTAVRVPAILDDYALSICSADFNDWVRKTVSIAWPRSYLYTPEYDQPEFNLGHTLSYAEMAYLIFPRPFMVERGFDDAVAPDRWVASEYAKVRRFYQKAGLDNRTEIEWFKGGHTIHGVGTFDFLKRFLRPDLRGE